MLIAACTSGAGKTVLSLAIMRAMVRRGTRVRPAKSGPDYIDPTYHAVAAGAPSVNLDAWAMDRALLSFLASGDGQLVVEGAMGLFDGAADGLGSAADLAALLNLPVVLIVDAARTSHSAAAMLRGFASHRHDVRVRGVIVNRVSTERHTAMVVGAVRRVCDELAVELLGAVPRARGLVLPSRHLGLVPANERSEIDAFVDGAADIVQDCIDWSIVDGIAGRDEIGGAMEGPSAVPPLGQRIAVASDIAFAFAYPHVLDGWRRAGAEIVPFSPLADEGPSPDADAVFLPGGYPELHASRIASADRFMNGLRNAAERGSPIYGECGGYMVLGETLMDAGGAGHRMAGLLPLETSFAERRLHLGYRRATSMQGSPFGRETFAAHEHHHSTIVREGTADPLFAATDACGQALPPQGLRVGTTCGSFLHLICRSGA